MKTLLVIAPGRDVMRDCVFNVSAMRSVGFRSGYLSHVTELN